MSVNFLTTDPTINAYDKAEDQADKQGQIQQQLNVDTAVRSGINNMLDNSSNQPPPVYQAPAAAPPPAPAAAPPTNVQTVTAQKESGGDPTAVNSQGYSGKYQFGKAALIDAGIYQPAPHEDISNQGPGQWWGTFNIPGANSRQLTYQQFLNDPQAQDMAWRAHVGNLDNEIINRGLDKYYGQTIGGVPITHDSLIEMMHGGGPAGVQKFLQTGGQYNPADSNGQSLANFGMRVAGGAPVQPPPSPGINVTNAEAVGAPPGVAPSTFMPGFNQSRYDPILRALAATPGGGTAALSLLNNQGRFDQANYRRMDTYQRLAMTALAHGDTQTARYYAAAGGMQLPENVMSSQNNSVLMGRGSLLAQRIYGADPAQAQRFVQTFMANGGDVTGAFTAAGTPKSNPGYKLEWAQQEDGTLRGYLFAPRTGAVSPATNDQGAPVVQAPKPSQANLTLDHKIDLLTSTGMPRDEAVQAATGVGLRPATIANAYQRIYSSYANSVQGMNASEPERQQAVENQMQNLFGPGWRQFMGPGGAYQAPAAAPPTPQPGTATPSNMATPGTGGPQAAPTGADMAQSIANAKSAIARGVPRAMVIQRLQQNHIPIPADL